MNVFTAQQMRDFDKTASEEYHLRSVVLMENAALRVVEFLEAKFKSLRNKKIVLLCGKGNNGGDGLAVARHLEAAGCDVNIFFACEDDEFQGDAKVQFDALQGSLFPPTNLIRISENVLHVIRPDLIIDALLGTGFKGDIKDGPIKKALDFMAFASCPCIAVDIPSGLQANDGDSALEHLGIDYTITFAAPKRGFFVRKGPDLSGEIWVGNIGTTSRQHEQVETGVEVLDLSWAKANLPRRPIDAHKGDAGRALIVGGSFGMSGAIALASKAALNVGAGLCISAIPEKIMASFAASILEATSHPLPCDENGKLLEIAADELPQLWKGVQVVALGPGISRSDQAVKFVRRVVRECPVPLIIDADALHALPDVVEDVRRREAETILTPHPGEMGTLMSPTAKEVNDSRFEVALGCAQKYNAFIVLKGARSFVATPDGRIFVNLSGNPGMATGGSGDALTGAIAGLLAQLKDAEEATKLGVYLHGYAGDLAYESKGNGLIAGDIVAHLAPALVQIPKSEVEAINGRLKRLM